MTSPYDMMTNHISDMSSEQQLLLIYFIHYKILN